MARVPSIYRTIVSTVRNFEATQHVALSAGYQRRSIFIQTEATPNHNVSQIVYKVVWGLKLQAIKFLPACRVLPKKFPRSSVEYTSHRATISPPHRSQLAARLIDVPGLSSVLFGPDFLTVTKDEHTDWPHIKAEVFSLVTETINMGEPFIKSEPVNTNADCSQNSQDSLAELEDDGEVVSLIKELLETRIRPSIQEDGGDIEFKGFKNGIVSLKLVGACRTCDSSTVTLKNGIESMLMHYVSLASPILPGLSKNL